MMGRLITCREHVRPVAILAVLGEARTTLGRVRMKPERRTLEKVHLVSRLTIYHSDATAR